MVEKPVTPILNQRFVYLVPFKDRKNPGKVSKVPILSADGYVDYAHQMGLVSLTTKILDRWVDEVPAGTDENGNPITDKTRWIIVEATAVVVGPNGREITATGISCCNDRMQFSANKVGMEVAMAETRAKKRALADACNITEIMINPAGKAPTRESVDVPLEQSDVDDEPAIPSDVKKPGYNIKPPLANATHPSADNPAPSSGGFGFDLE